MEEAEIAVAEGVEAAEEPALTETEAEEEASTEEEEALAMCPVSLLTAIAVAFRIPGKTDRPVRRLFHS